MIDRLKKQQLCAFTPRVEREGRWWRSGCYRGGATALGSCGNLATLGKFFEVEATLILTSTSHIKPTRVHPHAHGNVHAHTNAHMHAHEQVRA